MFIYELTTLLYYVSVHGSVAERRRDSFPERLVPESRNGPSVNWQAL